MMYDGSEYNGAVRFLCCMRQTDGIRIITAEKEGHRR